jgi:DnaJ like chaperone protein
MGLLGALLGGSLGFLLLRGPLGLVLGGILGYHLGDAGLDLSGTGRRQMLRGRCPNCQRNISLSLAEPLVCPHCGVQLRAGPGLRGGAGVGTKSQEKADQETAQSAFMVALISLAAKVAKADGKVTREEVATFDGFLARELGMPAAERRIAARIFNQARDSRVPASAFARQVRSILAGQPDRLRDLVSLLLKIAWADGKLDPVEESLIRSIAADLGLSERDYAGAKALFSRGNPSAAYAVLGVEPTASETEIKRSYRRLAREYHPDKLAAKGLPEDFLKFANEKLQAINEAYELIREQRGF